MSDLRPELRGPVFEHTTPVLVASTDGALAIEPTVNPRGYAVVDTTNESVKLFTLKRAVADAFVAGFDYAAR